MNKLVKSTSWLLFSLLLASCGGSGGDGGTSGGEKKGKEETSTIPIAGQTSELKLNAFTMSLNVQANSTTQFNFNVSAEAEGLASYRFDSIFPEFHFKPNSGVIALKDNSGQVVAQYLAPQNSGTYHYTLQLKDSQGLTIEHPLMLK